MNTEIRTITAEQALPIRHKVMWPDAPIEYVKLEEDASGYHYGLFADEKLVSVISLFLAGDLAQFRKFATLESYQGMGYGTKLLEHVIHEAVRLHADKIWCNARLRKCEYYERFGLKKTEKRFERKGQAYVIMSLDLT